MSWTQQVTARILLAAVAAALWLAARPPGAALAGDAFVETIEPIASMGDPSVQRTLALLEKSAATYIKKRECFSCHHQTLPAVTLALAKEHGYLVDAGGMKSQAEFTLKYFAGRAERLRAGDGVPGGPFSAGYALIGLHAAGVSANDTTAALVTYLFKSQEKDGRWTIRTHRPPLEDSHFAATALSLRGIRLLANDSHRDEAARRATAARDWLVRSLAGSADDAGAKKPSLTNEDRAFRLLGLAWSAAERKHIERAAEDLLKQQRADGGWAQLAEMSSDAYATGQSLVALYHAGALSSRDGRYRRGLEFLRPAQRSDGSWLVTTRSKPIQTYFESDFPHGKSQFISIAGSSWATQALLLGETDKP